MLIAQLSWKAKLDADGKYAAIPFWGCLLPCCLKNVYKLALLCCLGMIYDSSFIRSRHLKLPT